MKKIIIILLLLQSCLVFGQENTFQKEWNFGVNAGITMSKIRFFPSISQVQLLQEAGGISVRYISEKNFGIQAELNYSMRGWKEKTDTLGNRNKYSRSLYYIELPIMTYVYFDLGKRTRLIFLAGPQIGYNLGEKILEKEIYHDEEIVAEEPKYYNRLVQRKLDYGILGGTGLELRTGIGNIIVDGRYYFGLSDIFNNRRSDDHQSSSNQVLEIKLTYFFKVR
ncbi:MAG: PorT family protein [Dysgonamonadaceae bacterium]|jgi:hypothetical protein|nr:PorT family protein [Dysgonamonadaceae bacterium]